MKALLRGRTAIVTGSGGGVGRGIALALAAEGANVVIAARRAITGEETAALIRGEGGVARCIETDIAQRPAVDALVAQTLSAFGSLDIVVHNATSGLSGVPVALEDIDEARLEAEASVALDAAFYLARAAFPFLRDHTRGRFVVLTSVEAVHGGTMNPTYGTVKAGQRGFIKALAREWGPFGILVNGVNPAALTESAAEYFKRFPDAKETLLGALPLQRIGDPRSDIGAAVVALCSDYTRFVTGQIINVNGGFFTGV